MAKHSVYNVWLGSLSDQSTVACATNALLEATSQCSLVSFFDYADFAEPVIALGCGIVVS